MTPAGQLYSQQTARRLAEKEHLILVCGHYEGIDERVMRHADEEISIGDYILTGGELPAKVVMIVEGEPVPEALLTGDHQKTEAWRLGQSLIRTLRRRPDLLRRRGLSERERHLLETEELTDEER